MLFCQHIHSPGLHIKHIIPLDPQRHALILGVNIKKNTFYGKDSFFFHSKLSVKCTTTSGYMLDVIRLVFKPSTQY